MIRYTERMPPFQGLGQNQTATTSLPIGPVYLQLMLRMQVDDGAGTVVDVAPADWATHVGDVRINVEGNDTVDVSAGFLVQYAQFFGRTLAPGVLPIYLGLPWATLPESQDATAYKSVGVASITVEMDVKSDKVRKCDLIAVTAYPSDGDVEEATASGLAHPRIWGQHLRMQRISRSYTSIGTDEVADLPKGGFGMLGIHVSSAAIADVEVIGNQRQLSRTDAAIRAQHNLDGGRVQQAGMTHLDFMRDDRLRLIMPASWQDFRLKLDFASAPGAYEIFIVSQQPK